MNKKINDECDVLKIAAFVNGELSPEEIERLQSHMEHCQKCESTFQTLLALKINADDIKRGLAPDLAKFSPTRTSQFRWQMWATAAALLLIMIGGLYIMRFIVINKPQMKMAAIVEKAPYKYYSPVMRGKANTLVPQFESIMELYNKGRYEEFVSQVESWIKDHPSNKKALFYEGVALYMMHKNREATQALKECLSRGNNESPEVLWYLANALVREKNFKEAKSVLQTLSVFDHPYAKKAKRLLDAVNAINQ